MTKQRTFTDDETGEKYKVLYGEDVRLGMNEGLVIRKIPKPVEKKTYYLHFGAGSNNAVQYDPSLIDTTYELTGPQAQAIADMLEAAMAFVTNRALDNVRVQDNYDLINAVVVARAALQEDA